MRSVVLSDDLLGSRRLVDRRLSAVFAVLIALMSYSLRADEADESIDEASTPVLRLGKRLFVEKQFSNPASNVPGSCHSCHRPEWEPGARRAYSDSEQYSLVPTHFGESTKRTTLRNTPSLLDVGGQARFNHDGQFATLEDVIAVEITSPHLGWPPDERESALDEIHRILLNDAEVDRVGGGTYAEHFKRAYGIDLGAMTREKAVGWVVKCLAEYVRSLKSPRTSAFDAFLHLNGLPAGRGRGESAVAYGESLLASVTGLEARKALKTRAGFSRKAYAGLKIFLRTTGESGTGNCVACHCPPLFSDGGFHNTGIAQAEYDAVHGGGAFARLVVPDAAGADRPVAAFAPKIEKRKQVHADLGYWNFVAGPRSAPEGRDAGSFLVAALGAFKTPTLRNLQYTDPYMHNGAYRTLEDALLQKVKACALARSGALRGGDGALSTMNIAREHIAPLVAFLGTLTDLSEKEFEASRGSPR